MKRFLRSNGISDERNLTEEKSTSTIENLRFSGEVIGEDTVKPRPVIAVVTSDYHILRARMLARRAGLNAAGSCRIHT